jgi:HD-GYP domain-containing protein (c-di-GMP phosphodiesterase class II)
MSEKQDNPGRGNQGTMAVVLLAGREELDRITRAAIARLPFRSALCGDAAEAERLAHVPSTALLVVDGEGDEEAVQRVVAAHAGSDAPQLLLLLPPGADTSEVLPDQEVAHYLARPFAGETLTALVRHLVEAGPTAEPDPGPDSIQARLPRPLTPNRLYEEARAFAATMLERARRGEMPDPARSRILAEEIHTDLLYHNALVNRSLEPHEVYDLASHCVNVAIIGGKVAMGMALPVEDVVRVIQAGLLHDLGMARLPDELIRKPTALSDDEVAELRRHPEYGADLLEDLGADYRWLQDAILHEHERSRGQGYPAGLVASQIDPVAQILGVSDVFEALSHPRTYRSPYTGLQALETVVGMQDEYFEPRVVAALVNEISAFPLDSYVQLSTGEIAQVVATNPLNVLRPTVEVLYDTKWSPLEKPKRLDLSDKPEINVARALLEAELPIT